MHIGLFRQEKSGTDARVRLEVAAPLSEGGSREGGDGKGKSGRRGEVPLGVISATRSSTLICSRPLLLITCMQQRIILVILLVITVSQTLLPRQPRRLADTSFERWTCIARKTRPLFRSQTYTGNHLLTVFFELITPAALDELLPEKLFKLLLLTGLLQFLIHTCSHLLPHPHLITNKTGPLPFSFA
jgi:hypothetical protein